MTAMTALTAADLTDETCHHGCDEPVVSGELTWDDRGPHQLIAIRTYRCAAGHQSRRETDGG